VGRIHLAQDRTQWWALVRTVMNIRVTFLEHLSDNIFVNKASTLCSQSVDRDINLTSECKVTSCFRVHFGMYHGTGGLNAKREVRDHALKATRSCIDTQAISAPLYS
jgi:hypothetical protein